MSVSPEIYLISSLLRDQDMVTAIKQGVTQEMFHSCPDEWEWLEEYWSRYRKMPSKAAFKMAFPEFRVKAVDDTGHFADEVRKAHARFLLTSVMRDCANKLADGDLDAAVGLMHGGMVTVAAGLGTLDDSDIITDWHGTYEEVERRHDRVLKHGMAGIPSGFITLDERTGGANPGDLVIVGARLGEGKSWFMQRWACAAAINGNIVQFDALEQSRAQVSMRIHTFLSSSVGKELFSNMDLMQGRNFNLKAYKNFLSRLKTDVKGKLHVSDTTRGKVTPMTVASQIERNKPDIVFIDYITLMGKKGTEWQGVAELSGEIKQIAMEYQIPIIAAAQLNRANGLGKEPAGAEALAQSDAIGQDADMVITLRQQSQSVLAAMMAKSRNAPGGFKWYMQFQPKLGIFKEVTYSQAQDLKDKDADEADAAAESARVATAAPSPNLKRSAPSEDEVEARREIVKIEKKALAPKSKPATNGHRRPLVIKKKQVA